MWYLTGDLSSLCGPGSSHITVCLRNRSQLTVDVRGTIIEGGCCDVDVIDGEIQRKDFPSIAGGIWQVEYPEGHYGARFQVPEGVEAFDLSVTIPRGTPVLTLSEAEALRAEIDRARDEGLRGETGPEGPQGLQGEPGPPGEPGLPGPQGEPGERGPQGLPGPEGVAGPEGPRGLTGPVGERGEKGETGEVGPRGADGPAGERGPAGADGAPGRDGRDGAQGDPGVPGQDGHSPTLSWSGDQIAVDGVVSPDAPHLTGPGSNANGKWYTYTSTSAMKTFSTDGSSELVTHEFINANLNIFTNGHIATANFIFFPGSNLSDTPQTTAFFDFSELRYLQMTEDTPQGIYNSDTGTVILPFPYNAILSINSINGNVAELDIFQLGSSSDPNRPAYQQGAALNLLSGSLQTSGGFYASVTFPVNPPTSA